MTEKDIVGIESTKTMTRKESIGIEFNLMIEKESICIEIAKAIN